MKNIGIIGGGIVGLCSAYYLMRAGHKVTIVDDSDLISGCSVGNAGMIVPSHIIPLAAPGMIAKGIRWMFDSKSPFYVRPRLNGDLIKWGYHFYRKSTHENVQHAIPALKALSLFSKSLYQQLSRDLPFDFGYQERGLMMLYQTAALEKEEVETAHTANENGIEAHVLSGGEVQKLEPYLKVNARGGIYFPGDAHIIPQKLVQGLVDLLRQSGVNILADTKVTEFEVEHGVLKATQTSAGEFTWDEVVIAAGSWSGVLAAKLGLSLPMQGGKGYSFLIPDMANTIQIPSLLLEARVAATPMGNSLRFGGTMEIAGIDHTISMNRVQGIVDAIPRFYPEMKIGLPEKGKIWHGLRPCSPDGLPFIGRMSKVSNVIVATGHGMMGLSLGPATGNLVAELVDEKKTSVAMSPFDPNRYG